MGKILKFQEVVIGVLNDVEDALKAKEFHIAYSLRPLIQDVLNKAKSLEQNDTSFFLIKYHLKQDLNKLVKLEQTLKSLRNLTKEL